MKMNRLGLEPILKFTVLSLWFEVIRTFAVYVGGMVLYDVIWCMVYQWFSFISYASKKSLFLLHLSFPSFTFFQSRISLKHADLRGMNYIIWWQLSQIISNNEYRTVISNLLFSAFELLNMNWTFNDHALLWSGFCTHVLVVDSLSDCVNWFWSDCVRMCRDQNRIMIRVAN